MFECAHPYFSCQQVVDVKADRVETVAVGGDPLLGGVDFDQALAHYLADM